MKLQNKQKMPLFIREDEICLQYLLDQTKLIKLFAVLWSKDKEMNGQKVLWFD